MLSAQSCSKLGLVEVPAKLVASPTKTNLCYNINDQLIEQYKDTFSGLGCLPGQYHIDVDETFPPEKHAPRRVPVALKKELKDHLEMLVAQNVITPVKEPTKWINSMVAVRKPGKIRLCIDPKHLNKAIKRPHYPLPTIEDILPKLKNAKVFSVLDAQKGFWQIELDESSSFLTTFWTPFGRFRWLRMPFGISSAPEEFQRRQHEVLENLNGVDVIADEILVYGRGETYEEALADHDKNLKALLQRARDVNFKFNKDKLHLRLSSVPYMGHLITAEVLKPDPRKTQAIQFMQKPKDLAAVQRYLGFVNYLSKFLPKLSTLCEPLRELTKKNADWVWSDKQDIAFETIKKLVIKAPVLRYYDVNEEVAIQCDASQDGLGCVLLQNGQPVAFASKTTTETEKRYAQNEKECLAIVYACKKFKQYILGKSTKIETDHKPFEIVFKKSLLCAPKRLQRMLLRLQKYSLIVVYRAGSQLYLADFLSGAPLNNTDHKSDIAD